jgi:transcription elongation factor Elf1
MLPIVEQSYVCPYCGEAVSSTLDLSAGAQQYVEDCAVCCQPIEIEFDVDGDELRGFSARRLDA